MTSRRGRAGRLALVAAGLVLRLLSPGDRRGEPAYSLAGDTPATGVAGLPAGWSLIAAGAGGDAAGATGRTVSDRLAIGR